MNTYVCNLPIEVPGKEIAHISKPAPLRNEARDLEIRKTDALAGLEEAMEIPLEWLEEQGIIDDSVRMYLHEISRVHLLTTEEERSLAKQREEGRRIDEIKEDLLHNLRQIGDNEFLLHITSV